MIAKEPNDIKCGNQLNLLNEEYEIMAYSVVGGREFKLDLKKKDGTLVKDLIYEFA